MNYGGLLQAYSLMTFLQKNQCEAIIFWKNPRKLTIKRFLRYVLECLPFHDLYGVRTDLKKKQNLNEFISMELQFIYGENVYSVLQENDFDLLVVGSDQVWRESYNADSRDDFFPSPCKEVVFSSYAASFGDLLSCQSNSYSSFVLKNLPSFSWLSVREIGAARELIDDHGIDVSFVCDPVLLLDSDHFMQKFCSNVQTKDIDLLVYTLDAAIPKELISKLNRDNTAIKIKNINHSEHNVSDFLRLFSRSKAVITDSYHGMIFSVLFGARSGVIVNSRRGSERFNSFADAVDGHDMLFDDVYIAIDYIFSDRPLFSPERLAEFQVRSREYLRKIIDL